MHLFRLLLGYWAVHLQMPSAVHLQMPFFVLWLSRRSGKAIATETVRQSRHDIKQVRGFEDEVRAFIEQTAP